MEELKIEDKWYKDKRVFWKFFIYTLRVEILLFILLFLSLLIDLIFQTNFHDYYSEGQIVHYIWLILFTSFLWWNLPDGKIVQPVQILLLFIIPISEFILLNISGISNWWGLFFIYIYYLILVIVLDYDLDSYSSSHSNNGELSAKFFESLVKGLFRKL